MLLGDRLTAALARTRRSGRKVALLFIDLDDFKQVNDTMGHGAGDQLLVAMSARMRATLRADDTLARFAGDEFVALIEVEDSGDAVHAARRLTTALVDPFRVAGADVLATASIGISIAWEGAGAEELLSHADAALYRAKEHGRGRFELFDEVLETRLSRRAQLQRDLAGAVEAGELSLAYQPIVDLGDGRVVAVEALLRWHRPSGVVRPDEFLPVAEETGLIVPIGSWVLREAVEQVAGWCAGLAGPPPRLWVNLSARQLTRALVAELEELCGSAGVDPVLLGVEVTEHALMRDVEATAEVVAGVRALGVAVALDDFGTGYSSLTHLKTFGVDVVKIDGSFASGAAGGGADSAIVGAVAAMGAALGLTVTAECVEDQAQHAAVRDLGCHLGQGYLFGAPMPASEFGALLGVGVPVDGRVSAG